MKSAGEKRCFFVKKLKNKIKNYTLAPLNWICRSRFGVFFRLFYQIFEGFGVLFWYSSPYPFLTERPPKHPFYFLLILAFFGVFWPFFAHFGTFLPFFGLFFGKKDTSLFRKIFFFEKKPFFHDFQEQKRWGKCVAHLAHHFENFHK